MDRKTIEKILSEDYLSGYQKAEIAADVIDDLKRSGYDFKRIDMDDLRLIVKIACRMQIEKIEKEIDAHMHCMKPVY